MKRTLLGTTALVAMGLVGAEEAQAKFDVTVNGSWNTAYGFVNEDHGTTNGGLPEAGHGRQNQAINQDWEVHFRAQQTLDNGLVVGGRVELEGATNNGAIVSTAVRPATIRSTSVGCISAAALAKSASATRTMPES